MPNFFFLIINEITADKKIAKPRTFFQIDFCNGLSFITFTAFAKCCVISMNRRIKKVQDFLVHHPYSTLLIICVLSLFPVLFGFRLLKWDNLSLGFTLSNYFSQCIQGGVFPYWNPYLNLGSPLYADLSSRFHYPVLWLFAYTSGYSIWSLHIEFFLIYFFTAVGAFQLFKLFHVHRNIALFMGVTLAFSGCMIGHAQHLTIITSYCLFVWIVFFLISILRDRKYHYALVLGACLSMSVTGGYIGMTIISAYIYLVIFFYYGYFQSDKKGIFSVIAALILSLVLSSNYLYALYLSFDHIARSSGISLAVANSDPFAWMSFFSLIHPSTILADSPLFENDLSMRNGYCGLLCIPLMLYAIAYMRTRKIIVLFLLAMLFAGISMGSQFKLRTLLYTYFPLMNYFRFSALFRFYTTFLVVLISLLSLQHAFQNHLFYRLRTILLWYVSICIFTLLLFYYLAFDSTTNARQVLYTTGTMLCCHLVFLPLIILVLKRAFDVHLKLNLVILIAMLDMIVQTQILAPTLLYTNESSLWNFQTIFHKNNKSIFSIPDKTIDNYHYVNHNKFGYLLQNDNMILKEPSLEGYNPFKLKNFYEIEKMKDITHHKMIYTSDERSVVQIHSFSPTRIGASVFCLDRDTCILGQNYFDGWTATVDSKPSPLVHDPYFPKIILNAGRHDVLFVYEKPEIKILHYALISAWILLLVAFFLFQKRARSEIRS
jgi:hypothetical protein